MATTATTTDHVEQYRNEGYTIIRGMFSKEECQMMIDHYMELRGKSTFPGDFAGVDIHSSDPLLKYPRMIHMHRWDELSLKWLIDERLNKAMTEMLGIEPFATQTMLYFKPPGARGQALHQDQAYLRAKPGTCVAAWLALDDCDEENGCMQIVPGSHEWPLLCPEKADTTQSFTDQQVPLPEGTKPIQATMKAGDVLFFHGQTIHGSFPNRSKDRFRRALIGHYITGDAQHVASFYHPVLRMDGTEIPFEGSEDGGPCGIWTKDGGLEMVERERAGPEHE